MTSRIDENRGKVSGIRSELMDLLIGMDYCLDWKPDPSAWSVRQVVYHILDTPAGGIHRVINGMLSGELTEFEIWADLDNMTAERMGYDLEQLREDLEAYFHGLNEAIESATEGDLDEKPALLHLRSREVDEDRTVQELLDRAFEGHWRGHMAQISDLRDSLGM